MRITNEMIANQAVFNLSRNIERFMKVQMQMSTARRINTASDDPIGTQHDLGYRRQLREIEQFKSNANQSMTWQTFYDSSFGDLKDFYTTAKEIAVTMANDTNDAVARAAAANEIKSILEQVMQIANDTIDDRFIFSGYRTKTKPFTISANGAMYEGDTGVIEAEIGRNTRITSNLIGSAAFLKQLRILGEDADLDVGVTDLTPLADLHLGTGIESSPGTFEIYDRNRDLTYLIDISGATTVGEALTTINSQLGAASNLTVGISDDGTGLVIEPVTGTTNSVTLQTPLTNLNEGRAVDQDPGTFRIRNADSSLVAEVDISGASTVGEVVDAINNALSGAGIANVTAGLNANGTGLAITDANGTPLGLVVEETGEIQTTAADLGILGSVGATMQGRDLEPLPDFEIRDQGAQTTAADLGIAGSYSGKKSGADLNPILRLTTPVSALKRNLGLDLGLLRLSQGERTVSVDLGKATVQTVQDIINELNASGLDIEASINANGTGIQVVPTIDTETLIIENSDSSRTASVLGIAGSPDMIGTLILLETALRNDDRETVEALNGDIDLAIRDLLSTQAMVGARAIRVQTSLARLEKTEVDVTSLLSGVEDADITKVVTDLAREENVYQAALAATAKIIQPSLLNFIQ
jgi:flagellar hook-associated protein 3